MVSGGYLAMFITGNIRGAKLFFRLTAMILALLMLAGCTRGLPAGRKNQEDEIKPGVAYSRMNKLIDKQMNRPLSLVPIILLQTHLETF